MINVVNIKGEDYYLIPKNMYLKSKFRENTELSEAYKAMDALTKCENETAKIIFNDVKDINFIINACKVSKKENITLTLVSGTLRKLKAHGIIDTASRGPIGTDVTILNKEFIKILLENN